VDITLFHVDEFTGQRLKQKFFDLIKKGELRAGDSDEYLLDDHVLAPNLVFDEDLGENVIQGYRLMRASDFYV